MKYSTKQINAYINEFCPYDEEITGAAENMTEEELKALCEAIEINGIEFDEFGGVK